MTDEHRLRLDHARCGYLVYKEIYQTEVNPVADRQEVMVNLFSDLLHFCDYLKEDAAVILCRATDQYAHEIAETL